MEFGTKNRFECSSQEHNALLSATRLPRGERKHVQRWWCTCKQNKVTSEITNSLPIYKSVELSSTNAEPDYIKPFLRAMIILRNLKASAGYI